MKFTRIVAVLLGATACASQSQTPAPTPADNAPASAEDAPAPNVAPQASIDAPIIPRDAIFGNPERAQARVSPDGAMVSWLAPKDGVLNVWVAPVEELSNPKAITNDTYRGIRNHFWAANSKNVLFLQDEGGDENFHVYSSDVESGEVKDLTPNLEKARVLVQGLSHRFPNDVVIATNETNPQLFDLYRVNLKTGKRKLLAKNPGYASWILDRSLKPRLATRQVAGGATEVVTLKGKKVVTISAEDSLTTNVVGFNAKGTEIYVVDSRGRDKAALTRLRARDGKELAVLAEPEKADINNVLMHPTKYVPLGYSSEYLQPEWQALDDEFRATLEFLRENLPGNIEVSSTSEDLSKMVVYAEGERDSGSYHLYDRSQNRLTKMFDTRPVLADYTLQPTRPVEIPSRDGLALVSYLTLPPESDSNDDGRPDTAMPMVLWVHGGPWARDSYGYNPVHQWLANRGYAVLSVNYRGSTGFGKAFINAAVGEFAGKMHDDLIDAVNWAIDEGVANKDQIAIGGGSYGGYATLIGVTFTPDTFTCGVDIVGPSSLVTLIESFPEYWKPFMEGTWYKFVGDPADPEKRQELLDRSAISRVDDIQVPLLIGQGGNDPRVTKLESDQLAKVMVGKGLPVTYVNFPDEGHGFARPVNRLAFFAVMEGFLTGCLGGRAEPLDKTVSESTMQVLEGVEHVPGLADVSAGGGAAGASSSP
ncbi:MAG: S9 family peptidase [Myxococcota bacterium]